MKPGTVVIIAAVGLLIVSVIVQFALYENREYKNFTDPPIGEGHDLYLDAIKALQHELDTTHKLIDNMQGQIDYQSEQIHRLEIMLNGSIFWEIANQVLKDEYRTEAEQHSHEPKMILNDCEGDECND